MFYFRADGNQNIGMGHLMRSLSIALKMEDVDTAFICADEISKSEVEKRGLRAYVTGMEPFSTEEALRILDMAGEEDAILLDSYLFDNEYINILKRKFIVICMDDLAEKVFEADAVVNYNCYADEEEYEKLYMGMDDELPIFITGGSYIPLRDEFSNVEYTYGEEVKKILITTGGADKDNYAERILRRLYESKKSDSGVIYHVVCGAFSPHYGELLSYAEGNDRIVIHHDVQNMAELIASCDMAVSAGGSTCYELCAIGIPFIVFAYVKNQTRIEKTLGSCGAALDAGYVGDSSDAEVIDNVYALSEKMLSDSKFRIATGKTGHLKVDGQGALRLSNRLIKVMEGI